MQRPLIPVLGSDGPHHLAYIPRFLSLGSTAVSIQAVTPVDPAAGDAPSRADRVLDEAGRPVTGMVRPYPVSADPARPPYVAQIQPGPGGLVFLDVTFARAEDIPTTIAHRATQTQAGGSPASAVAGLAEVCRDDAVVAPPLRRGGWTVGFGCCEALSDHRTTVLPINGSLHPAQAFAINFIRLDEATGRAWTGEVTDLRNWSAYGQPVHAAVSGRVVAVHDGLPDQPIGALPAGIPIADALGSHVIIDTGAGRYAFYARMIPGSIRVTPGETVEAGAVLGQLGNSGNTSTPHLHFQIMDRPSALDANGLPFVLAPWTLSRRAAGSLAALDQNVQSGRPVDASAEGAGPRGGSLPLNLDIAAFD